MYSQTATASSGNTRIVLSSCTTGKMATSHAAEALNTASAYSVKWALGWGLIKLYLKQSNHSSN